MAKKDRKQRLTKCTDKNHEIPIMVGAVKKAFSESDELNRQ